VLLSRLAENLYWAGRYLERAEATARLVRVQTEIYLDLPRSVSVGWRPLLAVTGSGAAFDEVLAADGAGARAARGVGVEATEEHQVVRFLTTYEGHPGSVLSCTATARHNLRSVRALIPRSAWETANRLHLWSRETKDLAVPRRSRIEWLDGIVRRCQTLSGALDGTMSHDQAYAFLQVGRHLERADMTTRVIDVSSQVVHRHRLGAGTLPYADITWMGVLRSVSAMQMYRRMARTGVFGPEALQFLLGDRQFPRSVEHALCELSRRATELPRHEATLAACAATRRQLVDCDVLGMTGEELHTAMDRLQQGLGAIHEAVTATWFSPEDLAPPAPAPQPSPSQSQSQGGDVVPAASGS
jgi:uncharacterized alpha-E superfamily protein